MKLTPKILRNIPKRDLLVIFELQKLQSDLDMVRDRIKKTVRRTEAMNEYRAYTEGWLSAFSRDVNQSGSIASLIDTIVSEHVDEDGDPWDKDD